MEREETREEEEEEAEEEEEEEDREEKINTNFKICLFLEYIKKFSPQVTGLSSLYTIDGDQCPNILALGHGS